MWTTPTCKLTIVITIAPLILLSVNEQFSLAPPQDLPPLEPDQKEVRTVGIELSIPAANEITARLMPFHSYHK